MSTKSGRPALNFSNKTAPEKPVEVQAPAVAPAVAPSAKSGGKKSGETTTKAPAFTMNPTLLVSLLALTGPELIAAATEKGIDKKWLADGRVFVPHPDYANGDKTPKVDMRGAIMAFVLDRHAKGDVTRGAELNSFMHLGAGELFKGKYDLGYPAAAKENNGSRGMIAKGMLRFAPVTAGVPAPEQPAAPATPVEAPAEQPVETPAEQPAE